MLHTSSEQESPILAPSSAVPGWTAEYAVPLGGPGHLLLATFEQAAIGIAHLTLDEDWISVNQRFCEITGYSREEILQLRVQDLSHPEEVPASLGLSAFLQSYIANLITAGVRLVPLGQTDGQLAIAELEEAVQAASRQAEKSTVADLGSAAFMVDLASAAHETQYTRLFRS